VCSLALAFQNCINIFSTGVLTLKDHTPANAEATTASTMKRQIDVDRITSLKTSLRSAKRTQLGVLLTGLVETSKRRNRCSVSPAIAIRAFRGSRMGRSRLVSMWMNAKNRMEDVNMHVKTW
jgi:hypothetical protein